VWAIVPRGARRPVGSVLLVGLPDGDGVPTGDIEVGWHLHPDAWGNGYATEAARGALDRGFAAGLREVFAVVRPGNEPSQAVCRRLHMEHLGRTNRYYGLSVELFRYAGVSRVSRWATACPVCDPRTRQCRSPETSISAPRPAGIATRCSSA
jgi:RimJ/RimL family protein N-acetyltransferase